jgi:adenylosuccinate lyase
MLSEAKDKLLVKTYDALLSKMASMAEHWAHIPMLSRTHGQTASPTTVGKEIANFTYRLANQVQIIRGHKFAAKLNGAVGNYNAHIYAYPEYNWPALSKAFIQKLNLKFNPYTTQIEPHDTICMFYSTMALGSNILIGMSRDIWQYTSIGYFKQKTKKGEIGSSTMPHKVNPIDFENCEGNLGFANSIMDHFSSKLPISRMQRDLSDSTVLRNQGLAFGYSLLGFKSLMKGFDKLEVNQEWLRADLESHYEVVT